MEVEDGPPRRWRFYVWRTDPPIPSEDFYLAGIVEVDDSTAQTESLHNFGAWGRRKGVSEALFEAMHRSLGCTIVSSRRYVEGEAEWQTPFALRMWERFVANGLAHFDSAEGRYVFLPAGEG